jgi:hypothetical protein
LREKTSSLDILPISVSINLFDKLVRPILTYNSEISFMDYFLVYHRAKQRATCILRNGIMDHFTFIDRTPFEKVHLIFCKHLLGTKKTSSNIDLFILKNIGAAIIDFRVCPPLVKCKNLMFSRFIDTLMYGFSSTGVTIYCYFGLKFNDNTCCEVICIQRYNDNDIMTTNKLPGM